MVVNACVYIHQTLHKANKRLQKRGARTITLSPRSYLDLINHYAKLMLEKKSNLEEQQVRPLCCVCGCGFMFVSRNVTTK